MLRRLLIPAAFLVALSGDLQATTLLLSDFDDGTLQGWTINGSGSGPVNVAAGGLGGTRFLQTEDTADGFFYFQAPPSWTGDFFGGSLTYYLRNDNPNQYGNVGYYGDGLVQIMGGGPTLYFYNTSGETQGAGFNAWSLVTIPFTTAPNWGLSQFGPTPDATDAEIIATLSSVTSIRILADWVSGWQTASAHSSEPMGPDDTGLDNVSLTKVSAPEPASILLLSAGLGALGILRRRRA